MSKLMTILTLTLCFTITVGACGDDVLGPGGQDALLGVERAGPPDVLVMNWNLYVGAPIEQIALAGSLDQVSALRVMELQPDWIAVRGAVCQDGRNGVVCFEKVRQLRETLDRQLT